jgi:hypothetical protein
MSEAVPPVFRFRPIKWPRPRVPVATFTPATDGQLNAYRVVERNPARRELVICEAVGSDTWVSGQPFTALEGNFIPPGSGQALDTNGVGLSFGTPPIILPAYVGELYAVGAGVASNLQLAELVDVQQSVRDNVIPTRFITKFFATGSLPVQGAGAAPSKILEPDPDGLRSFILLHVSFGAVYLSTTPTPGDTRSLFQYGVPGAGSIIDNPFLWTAPFVPRSGLFATGDAGGHRLWVTEGFGR